MVPANSPGGGGPRRNFRYRGMRPATREREEKKEETLSHKVGKGVYLKEGTVNRLKETNKGQQGRCSRLPRKSAGRDGDAN